MAHTETRKARIAEGLRKFYAANPDRCMAQAERFREAETQNPEAFAAGRQAGSTNSPHRPTPPTSLLEVSSRTVRKVLTRLKVGCSRCSWSEGISDIHHIRGRKIPDANNHNNLTLICPNCHRLVHERKVKPETLIPLSVYIGDTWKRYYYPEKAGI